MDDSEWSITSLAAPWTDQGLFGYEGDLWYRRLVDVEALPARDSSEFAVVIGALSYGSYRLFADGTLVGTFRSSESPPPFPRPQTFRIPTEAVGDGKVQLALLVHRVRWASDVSASSRPAVAGALFGSPGELDIRVRSWTLGSRQADLGILLFAVVALVVGIHHLLLFSTRLGERHYLWLGLGSWCFAVNAIAASAWAALLYDDLGLGYRLTDAAGHLAAACLIPFLWGVLDRSMGPILRGYQWTHVALAFFVATVPLPWVVGSERLRLGWLLLFLAVASVLLVRDALRNHPDARILLVGGVLLGLAEVGEYLRILGHPVPPFLPYAGYIALLLSMATALAARFSRAHRELDQLRLGLAQEVEARTEELRLMAETASKASEAKGALLATLSHELREPLKSIVAFSRIILDRPEPAFPEPEADYLRRVEAAGQNALGLVSDLLDLSRLEVGRIRVQPREVDLRELVTGLCREMEPSAAARSVELTTEVPDHLDPTWTDPARLRQVLTNLVSNGIKFAPGGSVTIRVVADGGTPSVIEVADTGLGMGPDVVDSIFEPHRKGGDRDVTPQEGAGIGLSISRALCELLNYNLSISSTRGSGTVAMVEIGPPPTDAGPASDTGAPRERGAPPRP